MGRSGGDYACEYSASNFAQKEPTINDIKFHEQENATLWIKYNEYGMRLTVTDSPCMSSALKQAGYEYTMFSAIPTAKLKNSEDAYVSDNQFATTVGGCWSPTKHSYILVRKHDQKILTNDNFHIDQSWTKVNSSNKGLKF